MTVVVSGQRLTRQGNRYEKRRWKTQTEIRCKLRRKLFSGKKSFFESIMYSVGSSYNQRRPWIYTAIAYNNLLGGARTSKWERARVLPRILHALVFVARNSLARLKCDEPKKNDDFMISLIFTRPKRCTSKMSHGCIGMNSKLTKSSEPEFSANCRGLGDGRFK